MKITSLRQWFIPQTLIFFMLYPCYTQAEVRVGLEPKELTVGEQAIISLELDTSLTKEPEWPEIDGLKIERGRQSSSIQIINGHTTRSIQQQYIVTPTKPGKYTIPSTVIEVEQKKYRTPEFSLDVQQVSSTISDNKGAPLIFAERYFSKLKPFAGEPITVTTKLYYRTKVLEESRNVTDKISMRRIQAGKDSGVEKIDDQQYRVIRYYDILIPLDQGKHILTGDQLQLKIAAHSHRRRSHDLFDSFFDRAFTEYTEKTIATNDSTLVVRAIPPTPVGKEFSGIVGDFALKGEISKNVTTQGDSVTLTLTLSGTGILEGISTLPFHVADHIRIYEDQAEGEMDLNVSKDLTSAKTFQYALVPQKSGIFKLDPIEITVFDPNQEQFKTLSVDIGTLTVKPNPEWDKKSSSSGSTTIPQPTTKPKITATNAVKTLNTDIADIQRHTTVKLPWWKPTLTHFLTILGILLFGLLFPSIKLLGVDQWIQRQLSTPKHRKTLKKLVKNLRQPNSQDTKAHLNHVYQYFREYVSLKFNFDTIHIHRQEIIQHLHQLPYNNDFVTQLDTLLQHIERALYLSGELTPQESQALKHRLNKMLSQLEKMS
ncbi:MAG: BatD family protein [Zetaproteobacteria bacterium]|nr:BatD family protein [Zetaproteobacteria bacterium]